MKKFFPLLALALLNRAQAATPVTLRAATINASDLPKVIVPLDVMRVQSGIPVLRADDFDLLEDASKTVAADHVVQFRDTGMGLALIVALDASPSMKGRPLEAIRKGLAQLVNRKRSKDQIAVMSFADDLRWETRWNSSDEATQDAFTTLQTRGNQTRLNDAIEEATAEFGRQAQKDSGFPLRRCILLISDGHDEGSHTTSAQLIQDFKASGTRLDSVGLAHSPVWLGNLREISKAGFGEFLTASAPEDLTNFLSQGIDSLLDMPALEFQAQNLTADGKTHQLGIVFVPTGLRQQMELELPEPVWRTKRVVYTAGAGLALIVLAILLISFMRSAKPAAPKNVPQPVIQEAIVPSQPSAPPLRAVTVVEAGSHQMQSRAVAASISYGSPLTVAQTSARVLRPPASSLPDSPAALTLRALSGPYAGKSFQIDQQEFWIGSAVNNHLCLGADQSVSGNHLCIRTEQPFSRVYDNGSMNNTWINGQPISQQVTVIRQGDQLRVGASEFIVEAAGDA